MQLPVKTPEPKSLQGTSKRTFIQHLFSDIAPRYDWFNRMVTFGMDQGWRRKALTAGGVESGMRVLDVCAGTGDLALFCAEKVGIEGEVVGLDLNHAMLCKAYDKQEGGALSGWVQSPAEQLPFEENTFDQYVESKTPAVD